MRLVMLGTGLPVPRLGMAESSLAVLIDDDILLFDCGYGTTHQLLKAQIESTRLSHLFFTHHHYDHNADYAHVVLSSWVLGRTTPMKVYGPQGTAWMSKVLFKEMYAEDIRGRSTAGRPLEAVDVNAVDIDEGYMVSNGAWKVTALQVNHGTIPALGYKVQAGEKAIVISGDTIPVQSVQEAARGADLLIHEVHFAPGAQMKTKVNWEQWVVERGHTTPAQVGRLAAKAKVPRLALTHFFPMGPAETEQLIEEVRHHYDGEIIVGHDLLDILI